MNQTSTPEEKEKILLAYHKFQRELRKITHDHRATVSGILATIDQKQIQAIEEKIKNA